MWVKGETADQLSKEHSAVNILGNRTQISTVKELTIGKFFKPQKVEGDYYP